MGAVTRGVLLLGSLALILPGPARGVETTYQVANQLEGYYDSKLDESLIDNRLDALVSHGAYSIGATFLSHSPSDYTRLDQNKFGPAKQGIRKRWVEARTDRFGVRAGEVYSTFGRGLALAIFEDQVVDFDNGLDGASARAQLGRVDLEMLAGSNSYGTPFQVLRAARCGFELGAGFRAGLEGVWNDSTQSGLEGKPGRDRLAGALFQGEIGEHLSGYGEYVVRNHGRFVQGSELDDPQGHAGYANLNLSLGPLQILTEYKDLLRYALPFVNPPTAVRQHSTTLLNRATHVANIRLADERGGLVESYLNLDEKTRLTGSFSRSEARRSHLPAREAYGEIERWLGHGIEVIVRGAETEETVLEGADPVFFERITWGGNLVLPLSDIWSLDAAFETQGAQESNETTSSYELPLKYRGNLITCTLSRAPSMSWAVTTEWTDDERADDKSWVWAEWNVRLGDRYQLLLGGGRLRGGQVCSGGICKLVDPFEGGRLELLTTF